MNRRIDPLFDETPAGFPGTVGAMRWRSLLHGCEDGFRLPEDPE